MRFPRFPWLSPTLRRIAKAILEPAPTKQQMKLKAYQELAYRQFVTKAPPSTGKSTTADAERAARVIKKNRVLGMPYGLS